MSVGGVSGVHQGGHPEKKETKKSAKGKDPIKAMVSHVVSSVREGKPSRSISAPRVQANMVNPALSPPLIHTAIQSAASDSVQQAQETAQWAVASLPSMSKREFIETIVGELKTLTPEQQSAFWYNMAAFLLQRTS